MTAVPRCTQSQRMPEYKFSHIVNLFSLQLWASSIFEAIFILWPPGDPLGTPKGSHGVPEYKYNQETHVNATLHSKFLFLKLVDAPHRISVTGCQSLRLFYFSIFSKNSFARLLCDLSSTNPESLVQIASATLESISYIRLHLPPPWQTLTGAFGSDNMMIIFYQGSRSI